MKFAEKWEELEIIMLCEVSHSHRQVSHEFSEMASGGNQDMKVNGGLLDMWKEEGKMGMWNKR
jgi:hypothetical protein